MIRQWQDQTAHFTVHFLAAVPNEILIILEFNMCLSSRHYFGVWLCKIVSRRDYKEASVVIKVKSSQSSAYFSPLTTIAYVLHHC